MKLNVEVREEIAAVLRAYAQAKGVSPDRIASQVLEETLAAEVRHSGAPLPEDRPLWEMIADNMTDVPMEEFEKLPKDGASQVDHYLYGHPRR